MLNFESLKAHVSFISSGPRHRTRLDVIAEHHQLMTFFCPVDRLRARRARRTLHGSSLLVSTQHRKKKTRVSSRRARAARVRRPTHQTERGERRGAWPTGDRPARPSFLPAGPLRRRVDPSNTLNDFSSRVELGGATDDASADQQKEEDKR